MPRTKTPPKIDREWLDKLGDVVNAIARRENGLPPSQREFNKAADMTPRDNIARWAGPVSLYHVKDADGEHIVVVMDRGDDRNPADLAECSCHVFREDKEVCAHILTVLASHSGPLT